MKKKSLVVILMALAMFTSCNVSSQKGTDAAAVFSENVEVKSSGVDQVSDQTKDQVAVQVTDQEAVAVNVENTDQQAQTTNQQAQVIAATTNTSGFMDYHVSNYTFAEDGLSGNFTVATYDAYAKEYVMTLKVGDTIKDATVWCDEDGSETRGDIVIESLEKDADNKMVWINDCYTFTLQESGVYYLADGAGFMNMTSAGEKTLKIAADVKIIENANPYRAEGITENPEGAHYYKSVAEFATRLKANDVWYTPDLFLRVVDGEVKTIVVNPANHEPWYGELGDLGIEAAMED